MNAENKERFMYWLGGLIALAILAVVGLLIFFPVPEQNKETLIQVIGVLSGSFVTIVGYFFGSSKSSADKNAIIANKEPEKPEGA